MGVPSPATSYVLRVYHRGPMERIAGVIELPDSQRSRAFRCFGELKAILLEAREVKRTGAEVVPSTEE